LSFVTSPLTTQNLIIQQRSESVGGKTTWREWSDNTTEGVARAFERGFGGGEKNNMRVSEWCGDIW
jgi:hypothetical protein